MQHVINQPCGYPLTSNAATGASYGPELELTAQLAPAWTFTFAGTDTHATLTSVNSAVSAADTALVPGLNILNIPKYTQTASLNYAKRIFGDFDFTARLSNSLVGPMTDICSATT